MATITTGGSGAWSSTTNNAPWPGGTLPTAADDVVINNAAHVLTVDTTTAVAKSVTVTLGTLAWDDSVDTKIVVENGITGDFSASAVITCDLSAEPDNTCEIRINAVRATGAGHRMYIGGGFLIKGADKKAVSFTTAALTANSTTSVEIEDVTGWKVGDRLVFCTTQAYNATPRTDVVTIDTITPTTGTAATVAWSDGAGTAGAVLYDHADNCMVGNFTRNVIFGPNTAGDVASIDVLVGVRATNGEIRGVLFDQCNDISTFPGGVVRAVGSNAGFTALSDCAWYEWDGVAFAHGNGHNGLLVREDNVYFSTKSAAVVCLASGQTTAWPAGDARPAVFRAVDGWSFNSPYSPVIDPMISGVTNNVFAAFGFPDICGGGGVWSSRYVIRVGQGVSASPVVDQTRLGLGPDAAHEYSGANNSVIVEFDGWANVTLKSCPENVSGGSLANNVANASLVTLLTVIDRDADPDTQEVYQNTSATIPAIARDATATNINRSTSAIRMTWTGTASYVREHSFEILTKTGEPITLIGYFMKSGTNLPEAGDVAYGASTLPYVEVSGLGITPVRITMDAGTAAGAWEKFSFLPGTATEVVQSSGGDGLLTVTFVGQSAVSGAQCWFAGVPIAPFVTRARHYGYLFDETIPIRTVNATISAAEATAIAYTGMTVTWDPAQSDVTIDGDTTFQKLYDYTQADACLNVADALPLTGAGVAGNPALFAAADITIDTGFKLNGTGSISMAAFTLATEFAGAVAYTYTGGTWSQPTTIPTFSGGTLALGAEGTYEFNVAASTIITMAPTANAVTYAMGDCTFVGTVDLRNTHGSRTITVELPSGVSYTTANNTGAAITVDTPQIYQSVTLSGGVTGSRVQIYDTDAAAELYNDVPGSWPHTWTDGTPAAADRPIRVRVTKVDGDEAKEMIEASIGTCGQTAETAEIAYVVSQVDDDTYNTNAIDGPAIYATSGITFTDAATDLVNCDIAGGAVTWPTIYACFVHWINTAAGIADDITYIDAPDTANYLLTAMQIRNTDTVPLTITGGYGRDASTGLVADIIDTAGSTGNIFPSPDHVVPFSTGSGLTAGQDAALSAAEAAAELAASYSLLARKLLSNKRVLDPATGIETIYDDNGDALYTRNVYDDAAAATLYSGANAPHRVEKYATP